METANERGLDRKRGNRGWGWLEEEGEVRNGPLHISCGLSDGTVARALPCKSLGYGSNLTYTCVYGMFPQDDATRPFVPGLTGIEANKAIGYIINGTGEVS